MSGASTRSRGSVRPAIASAVALCGAAVWIILIERHVTVSDPPPVSDDWSAGELDAWYAWAATTMAQRRLALVLLLIGLAGIALTALRVAGGSWGSRGGAVAVAGAALLWAVADVAEAGGQRAVEQMAAYGNPIETVASIAYTIDVTTSWLEAAAALVLGLGAGAMAIGQRKAHHRLPVLTLLVSLNGVVFGILIVSPEWDATPAGLALGGVLLPIWVIWLNVAGPEPTTAGRRPIA